MIVRPAGLIALFTAAVTFGAEPIALQPAQSWDGSAEDESKEADLPKVITDAGKLAEVWKACERTDPLPTIDFKKHIVIVLTTRGSRLNPRIKLNPDGDVRLLGVATRDFRPGFRYAIGVYSREGVKSVDSKPLP